MTTKQLESFKKSKLKEIANTFRHHIKEQFKDAGLHLWPKYYYLAEGKGGYSDGGHFRVLYRVMPIDHGEAFLDCDTLEIVESDYSLNSFKKANDEAVAELNPENFNFTEKLEKCRKEAYEEDHSEVTGVLLPDEYLADSIVFGLDLSFKDFMSHYKGIEKKEIGREKDFKMIAINLGSVPLTKLTEEIYEEKKEKITRKLAKDMLSGKHK